MKELALKYGKAFPGRLKKMWLSLLGQEKGGLTMQVNPEGEEIHIMDMIPSHAQDEHHKIRISRLLKNMGGLTMTGSITDSKAWRTDPTKAASSNKPKNQDKEQERTTMLRVGISPQTKAREIGRTNGRLVFGVQRAGNFYKLHKRTSPLNTHGYLKKLTKPKQ